jgi:hypothetical protein
VSIGYTAICSELSRLADVWGDGVLLLINLAFYIPSIPLLAAGAAFDHRINRRFGQARSNCFRLIAGEATAAAKRPALAACLVRCLLIHRTALLAGFGGCALVLAAFPYAQGSMHHMLAAVSLLGIFSAAAAGSSYSIATQQGDDGNASVAVALGYVSPAPVVLLVESLWHMGSGPWVMQLTLYWTVATVCAAALVAAVALARRQQRQEHAPLKQPPVAALEASLETPMLEWNDRWMAEGTTGAGTPAATAGGMSPRHASTWCDDSLTDVDVMLDGSSMTGVAGMAGIWPAALALGLSVTTSMCLFPLFTRFRSSGALGDAMLPVWLFWMKAAADIVGRVLPKVLCGPPPRACVLVLLAVLRVLLLPLALLHIVGGLGSLLQSDWLLVAYVALQWLASGAVDSWAFQILPRLVPPAQLGTQAASLTLVFNTSCLLGLLLAIPVQHLLV